MYDSQVQLYTTQITDNLLTSSTSQLECYLDTLEEIQDYKPERASAAQVAARTLLLSKWIQLLENKLFVSSHTYHTQLSSHK